MQRGLGSVYRPKWKDANGIVHESPTWWIRYYNDGVQIRESADTTNQVDARTFLKQRLGEIGAGKFISPDARKLTFADLESLLITDYEVNGRKSLRRCKTSIAALKTFFGKARVSHITTDRIKQYISIRQAAEKFPATIQKELAALKRMFALAIETGKMNSVPFVPSVEVRNTRKGFFEEKEFLAIQNHLPAYARNIAEFMYLTGWRLSEVLTLEWKQVDWASQTVRLEPGTTKNDDGREFPFSPFPALEVLLKRQKDYTAEIQQEKVMIVSAVFHRNGRPIKCFRTAWRKACESAGLPGRWRHDFRRTAVRNLERVGVSRSAAMKLTGHKTEAVYRRYAIVSRADLIEGVAKLSTLHPTGTGNVSAK